MSLRAGIVLWGSYWAGQECQFVRQLLAGFDMTGISQCWLSGLCYSDVMLWTARLAWGKLRVALWVKLLGVTWLAIGILDDQTASHVTLAVVDCTPLCSVGSNSAFHVSNHWPYEGCKAAAQIWRKCKPSRHGNGICNWFCDIVCICVSWVGLGFVIATAQTMVLRQSLGCLRVNVHVVGFHIQRYSSTSTEVHCRFEICV